MGVLDIAGGGDESQSGFQREQSVDFRVLFEFCSVTTAELREPFRAVAVPLAQLR